MLIGLAVCVSYASRWVLPQRTAVVAGAAYLGIEGVAGRLGYDHYRAHIAALVLLAVAVLGAGAERARRDAAHEDLEAALARAGAAIPRQRSSVSWTRDLL